MSSDSTIEEQDGLITSEMSSSNNTIAEELVPLHQSAPLHGLISSGIKLLVLGESSVGKSTLISAAIKNPVSSEKSAFTLKFEGSDASITEINGLHAFNKTRGQAWRSIVEFVYQNKIDIIWFCTKNDFLDNNDELWNWTSSLLRACHVIIVRTKCLSPSDNLQAEASKKFPDLSLPVVSVLAQDIQLNPKGGGATVEEYGVDDLITATESKLKIKKHFSPDAFDQLSKQAKRDAERYVAEEGQKEVMVNALRSFSSAEGQAADAKPHDPLEEFVLVPRPEPADSGFVKILKSTNARTAVGALVAFAVVLFLFL